MAAIYALMAGPAPALVAPDLPAEVFCSCGALLITEEEQTWGACSVCLDAPIRYELTEEGRRHADR